jgi:hypothetical protein
VPPLPIRPSLNHYGAILQSRQFGAPLRSRLIGWASNLTTKPQLGGLQSESANNGSVITAGASMDRAAQHTPDNNTTASDDLGACIDITENDDGSWMPDGLTRAHRANHQGALPFDHLRRRDLAPTSTRPRTRL